MVEVVLVLVGATCDVCAIEGGFGDVNHKKDAVVGSFDSLLRISRMGLQNQSNDENSVVIKREKRMERFHLFS